MSWRRRLSGPKLYRECDFVQGKKREAAERAVEDDGMFLRIAPAHVIDKERGSTHGMDGMMIAPAHSNIHGC